jgi:hypothetical protein
MAIFTPSEIRTMNEYISNSSDFGTYISKLRGWGKFTSTELTAGNPVYDSLKFQYDAARQYMITNTLSKSNNSFDSGNSDNWSKGGNFLAKLIKSQEGGLYGIPELTDIKSSNIATKLNENLLSPTSIFKDFGKDIAEELGGGKVNMLTIAGRLFNKVFGGGIDFIGEKIIEHETQRNALLEEINTKTSFLGKLSEDYRQDIIETIPDLAKMDMELSAISDSAIKLTNESGKFKTLSTDTWINLGRLSKTFVSNMNEVINDLIEFEKVGYGVTSTMKALDRIGRSSLSIGLDARKTTSEVGSNISKLNEYTFKNGVDGLAKMVTRATELRTSLQSTFSVAEKLNDLNSATDMVAKLQAMGGAINEFANPLHLINLATNDIEGLQSALFNANNDLVTYNEKLGKFGIEGVNIKIAKERASAMGVDYKELANQLIAQNERIQGSMDLANLLPTGKDSKEFNEFKELILNMSYMDQGQMYLNIPKNLQERLSDSLKSEYLRDNRIALSSLSKNQDLVNELQKYQEELKTKSMDDIIRGQASDIKNINRGLTFIVANETLKGTRATRDLAKSFGIDKLLKNSADFMMGDAIEYSRKTKDGIVIDMVKDTYKSVMKSLGFKEDNDISEKINKQKEIQQQVQVNNSPKEVTLRVHSDSFGTDSITRMIKTNLPLKYDIISTTGLIKNPPTRTNTN